jgi:PAS domain S-box-containing protein
MGFTKSIQEEILNSLGEGVFTVNKDFKINFFNKAAEKITGYKKSEVLGKFCKHVFRSEFCFHDCPIANVLKNKKNLYDRESKIYNFEGIDIPIKLNAAVLYNEEGEPNGGVISFRDITSIEAIRKELKKNSNYHGVIGHSKQMQEIFNLIDEVADSKASVFIHGESGTGKEMIANAIQQASSRKDKPFVKMNCSVFPPDLLGSELFGHVKGAFTDAHQNRPGRFEVADQGTIFLDEVAEMPLQMQLQLLRVLQEGTFERIGESVPRKVNVRVIAATNLNIKNAISEGKFREDLFYRLNVIPIEIPPLRERMDDLVPLIKHFLYRFSLIYEKQILDIEDNALELLFGYHWPGNVRELENALEYAFVRTNENDLIVTQKLPPNIRQNNPCFQANTAANYVMENSPERKQILDVLEKNNWNKSKAAEELKMGRTTLWRKLKQYQIEVK